MIEIEFNGKKIDVAEGLTVSELLVEAQVEARHCAVELNLEIVSKSSYPSVVLRDGDVVEVVTLVGGG